ncbi:MAG: peptide ABC transporter substrate-binding protein [Chloroflexi bacterium]|nr:peptide ABC transporter substrate-binding protein [Chloroflexota bacterium]
MSVKNHTWPVLAVMAMVIALFTACGAPTNPTTAPAAPTTAAPATGPTTTSSAPTTAAPAAARGTCGTLRLLWWQAPTIANPHLATGTKDYDVSRVVYEPLAGMGPDGVPDIRYGLAAELPTLQNGGVSADGKSITWKLKQGVKWHDGSAFTADDVVFTYQFASDKATAATSSAMFADIDKIEKLDDFTVKLTWKAPNATPYQAFVGYLGMIIQKKAFQDYMGAKAKDAPGNLKPIGTGAYKMREFKPNDQATFDMNENYREAGKPCFKEVIMKGGGDATSAARAVLQTGDVDYAWNLQVAADVLKDLAKGGKGDVVINLGASVERIQFNRANPDPALGDKRAEPDQPNLFFTDPKVRLALSLASDRKTIAEQLYGGKDYTGGETCNILVSPAPIVSTTKFEGCEFNLDKANKLLDDAGWAKGSDGLRHKVVNGKDVKMQFVYQTSVNPVRQSTQEIIKQSWEKLGVKVELKSVQAGVFFSDDVANPDTYPHFFTDVQMYTNGPSAPDDIAYVRAFTCEKRNSKANEWRGTNVERYCSPDFDKIIDALSKEIDPAKRIVLYKQVNDQLMNDTVMIPLVQRNGTQARSKDLKGVVPNTWDSNLWNLADWRK